MRHQSRDWRQSDQSRHQGRSYRGEEARRLGEDSGWDDENAPRSAEGIGDYGGYSDSRYGSSGRFGGYAEEETAYRGDYSPLHSRRDESDLRDHDQGTHDEPDFRTQPWRQRSQEGWGGERYPHRHVASGSNRGKGPKGYERSDDRLKEIICERLSDDPDIDASEITVNVTGATVTLTGTVDSRSAKYAVEEMLANCGGVKDVDNQLRVRTGLASNRSSSSDQSQLDNSRG